MVADLIFIIYRPPSVRLREFLVEATIESRISRSAALRKVSPVWKNSHAEMKPDSLRFVVRIRLRRCDRGF
jgi:hypothetical protein